MKTKMETQQIEIALTSLVKKYKDQDDSGVENIPNNLLCKMAALELCGWIEDTHDEIILNCLEKIKSNLNNSDTNFKKLESDIKKQLNNTHGLSYTNHLRKLLVLTLGEYLTLKLEKDIATIESLQSELDTFHHYRNDLAHQSVTNPRLQQLLAPNIVFQKFQTISIALKEIEDYLSARTPI